MNRVQIIYIYFLHAFYKTEQKTHAFYKTEQKNANYFNRQMDSISIFILNFLP